ncbi:hypothetical protein NT239_12710 [Chitinibacter sp. SCUT-21]|uniref:hypothetical protein n=1 Tax=Chitinibacter sp. SCUT-21 TaxID=2970891 RepID=UPI0035A6B310
MKLRIFILLGLLLCTLATAAVFIILQERERDGHWPWPLNGRVNNQSAQAVQVWDDDHGNYTVAAHSQSSNKLDIDHAFEATSGRWCKLSAHTLIVNADGRFANCQCFALNKGRPCIKF